ncbi:hypothetical protein [Pengzhenrongella phosphoraccumulans]|uniref:hypothetical protein n=1 Tax=Pengzhenrongella phosphoraccumulans TaxID=3114394 RepID=UPI0038903923
MALVPCTDLSAAGWIADNDQPWDKLVSFGPSGFSAYARLRFIPDPEHEGQSENDVDHDVERSPEAHVLCMAVDGLAGWTSTPDDCYFLLWDGWYSDLYGSDGPARPSRAPAFPRSVLDGPKVVLPNRAFLLFRGPLSDFGNWGAAVQWPGQPRSHMPGPAFVWPADHAWCVTKDVDPHWAGIGADALAITSLMADDRLDVVYADPSEQPPRYR